MAARPIELAGKGAPFVISRRGILLSSITLVCTAEQFQVRPASSYAHQESENVTLGAQIYNDGDSAQAAFGKKINFAQYGVVPLLVVLENKRKTAVDLRAIQVTLVAEDGRKASAVSPESLSFLATNGKHGSQNPVKIESPVPLPKKKNPLTAPEISQRAFSAQMLAPGDSASGFFYFEAKSEPGDRLYVTGLQDARSKRDLLYFEFLLDK